MSSVVAILGDQTDLMYSFFRDGGGKDECRTIVVGKYLIIDIISRNLTCFGYNTIQNKPSGFRCIKNSDHSNQGLLLEFLDGQEGSG